MLKMQKNVCYFIKCIKQNKTVSDGLLLSCFFVNFNVRCINHVRTIARRLIFSYILIPRVCLLRNSSLKVTPVHSIKVVQSTLSEFRIITTRLILLNIRPLPNSDRSFTHPFVQLSCHLSICSITHFLSV